MITYVNKSDLADLEMRELVELEVRELLTSYGYDGDNSPVIFGSALQALENHTTEFGRESILKLINTCDSYIPSPKRDLESPFLLPIEKSVAIPSKIYL